MRTIIFGGSGFIGTHLAKNLVADGASVTLADIVPPDVPVAGATYEYCDIREPIVVEHGEAPYDVVYNLAAVHRTPGHEPSEYYETNVTGAQTITDWCETGGETRLIFTSSIAIYGPSEEIKRESTPPTPNSDYGRSKLIAEAIHERWQRAAPDSRRLAIVRPAVVFGPGEKGNFTRLAGALAKKRFVYIGRSDVVKSCGHVDDLVRALRFAETLDDPTITFNYCYPKRYTIAEICQAFHDTAGFELPRTLPQPLISSVMKALKLVNPHDRGSVNAARVTKLTASTNIEPEVLVSRGFEWETDIDSAIRRWQDASNGTFV